MKRNICLFVTVACFLFVGNAFAASGDKNGPETNGEGGYPLFNVKYSNPAGSYKHENKHEKQFPEIELLYNTSESNKAIAEVIKDYLKNNLGIEVTLVDEDWKTYLMRTSNLDYSLGRAGWFADYADPVTFLNMWVSGGVNNNTGWSNDEYDGLLAAADSEGDAKQRMDILRQAESMLINDEAPILPIYFYVSTNMVQPYVKGMSYNMKDTHFLKNVWIEKQGRPAPDAEQILTFINGPEPETLDPAIMTDSIEFNIAMQLFEGLLINNPDTLAPEPAMAKSWTVSPDGIVYTFHLRQDALWSNGDPVNAEDFRYSWLRVLKPETASDYAYQLFNIKNAEAFNKGKTSDPDDVGIKVIDKYTLEVTLKAKTAYFLDLVAFPTLFPVNKHCIESYGSEWTQPENIVTNGPFTLTSWTPNENFVMSRNPEYFGAGNVKLKKIIALASDDNFSKMRMFEAGETDWVRTLPTPMFDKWRNRNETHIKPILGVYYYRLNVSVPPFNDKRVRLAINLAIDKKAICEQILKQGQTPAETFVPPGLVGYVSPDGPVYNPQKARELLREAGYVVNTNKTL